MMVPEALATQHRTSLPPACQLPLHAILRRDSGFRVQGSGFRVFLLPVHDTTERKYDQRFRVLQLPVHAILRKEADCESCRNRTAV